MDDEDPDNPFGDHGEGPPPSDKSIPGVLALFGAGIIILIILLYFAY